MGQWVGVQAYYCETCRADALARWLETQPGHVSAQFCGCDPGANHRCVEHREPVAKLENAPDS